MQCQRLFACSNIYCIEGIDHQVKVPCVGIFLDKNSRKISSPLPLLISSSPNKLLLAKYKMILWLNCSVTHPNYEIKHLFMMVKLRSFHSKSPFVSCNHLAYLSLNKLYAYCMPALSTYLFWIIISGSYDLLTFIPG